MTPLLRHACQMRLEDALLRLNLQLHPFAQRKEAVLAHLFLGSPRDLNGCKQILLGC